jgi:hypothetical protein
MNDYVLCPLRYSSSEAALNALFVLHPRADEVSRVLLARLTVAALPCDAVHRFFGAPASNAELTVSRAGLLVHF